MNTIVASDSVQLAVIIPAFKSRFLACALESLVGQTDKRFRVYIGDDHSPENLASICETFKGRVDLVYKRFDQNLGRQTLTGHWDRCVHMSSEPWVWLFSDDDVMEPQCVESFYGDLEVTQARHDVYRFNTLLIDEDNRVVRFNPPHPHLETGRAFAYHRLMFHRSSCVTEYVFSRRAFDRENGFVDFPLAWLSDDASLIAFTGDRPIYTVAGPNVRWRLSDANISGKWAIYQTQKIDALLQYLDWLKARYDSSDTDDLPLSGNWYATLGKAWFFRQLRETKVFLGLGEGYRLARRLNSVWFDGVWIEFGRLVQVNIRWTFNRLKRSAVLLNQRRRRQKPLGQSEGQTAQ